MEAAELGNAGFWRSKGLTIEFSDLRFKAGGKVILDGVSGRFRSGHLCAVMGPSGAGKTSLLNILSGFTSPSLLEGTITLDGEPRDLTRMRQQSCYITQEFAMLEYLSVRETMHIAANLKLGPTVGNVKKNIVVDDVASTLGLVGVMETRVHSLSGGEKKRLSIGLELVSNPPILFCDEPTSGLDSYSSLQVMTRLQSLAHDAGRTIIVVIHSPSSRLLELVDDLFLLANGQCIYNGTLLDLLPTFESIGIQCPQYYNRADFALEVACKERGDHILELVIMAKEKHQKRIGSFYEDKPPASEHVFTLTNGKDEIAAIALKEEGGISKSELTLVHRDQELCDSKRTSYGAPRFTQFWILFKRAMICSIRDLKLGFLRITLTSLVALLIGSVYYDFGQDGSKLPSNFSCIFFIVMYHFYAVSLINILLYPQEVSVIVREHFNNWYALSMYYLAKIMADLPYMILSPMLFVTISYYLTDQPREWDRFLLFLLINIVLTVLGVGVGSFFGTAFSSQVGIFLMTTVTMPMFLISGFFIHLDDLSPYVEWLSYVSIFRYALESASYAIFGLDREPLECPETFCPYDDPKKFLIDLGLENPPYWRNILVLCFCIVLSQIALYLALRRRISKSKER